MKNFVLYYQDLTILIGGSKLLSGALDELKRHGVTDDNIDIVKVPGAFEIPITAQKFAQTGKYNAIITRGAVIRGATAHFDYVSAEVSKGIAQVSLQNRCSCNLWSSYNR